MEQNKESAEVTPPKDPSQKDNQPERTEAEKAAFSLKKNAERAKELGIDPAEVLGIKPKMNIDEELTDDVPLTVGTFRQMQKQEGKKTALQLADELPETEREKVKQLLESRIVPSGNADEDLRLARMAVNAEHNAGIVELLAKRGSPVKTAAGASGDAALVEDFNPTPDEAVLMRPPYNLSKEKIIASRKKQG